MGFWGLLEASWGTLGASWAPIFRLAGVRVISIVFQTHTRARTHTHTHTRFFRQGVSGTQNATTHYWVTDMTTTPNNANQNNAYSNVNMRKLLLAMPI